MPTRFDVHIVPNSPRPGPDGRHGGVPRLRVASPPADGKANAEVERVLRRLLGCEVRIVGGGSSRRKVVEAESAPGALDAMLREAFGPTA